MSSGSSWVRHRLHGGERGPFQQNCPSAHRGWRGKDFWPGSAGVCQPVRLPSATTSLSAPPAERSGFPQTDERAQLSGPRGVRDFVCSWGNLFYGINPGREFFWSNSGIHHPELAGSMASQHSSYVISPPSHICGLCPRLGHSFATTLRFSFLIFPCKSVTEGGGTDTVTDFSSSPSKSVTQKKELKPRSPDTRPLFLPPDMIRRS